MSMLNQAAVEALCSATYLENYLDCLENLPDDLQRNVSQMRELDALCCDFLKDIDQHHDTYLKETDNMLKKKSLIQIQRALIRCQEIGDEKLQVVSQIIDHIENRTRQLEQDLENLDPEAVVSLRDDEKNEPRSGTNTRSQREDRREASGTKRRRQGRDRDHDPTPAHAKEPEDEAPSKAGNSKSGKVEEKQEAKSGAKRQRRQRQHHDSISKDDDKKEEKEKPKKKKKRKNKKEKEGDKSPIGEPIDPDEPTYCLCDQVSYGEMIGCDNDDCQIEWFHFNCVNLTTKPKGKWYCPKCRGETSKVKRADLK